MLTKTIKSLPKSPGVYQYFDKNGTLLYIGKAKNLNARVKNYFKFTPTLAPSSNLSPRIFHMVGQIFSLQYIKVQSEHDAFILENSLIKQLKPKYNILLRDDKTYPYIVVDFDEQFPRLKITRKVLKGKNIKYFGPFCVGAKDLLEAIYLLFKLVQKSSCVKGKKACLFHQINRCLAPCEGKITKNEYEKILNEAISFINNTKPLIKALQTKMDFYANSQNYEQAAIIRDMIKKITQIEPKNQIDLAKIENFDLLGLYVDNSFACGMRFFIRDGKIVSSAHQIIHSKNGFDIQEVYRQMLLRFYKSDIPMPINTIYIAHELEEQKQLQDLLFEIYGKKIYLKYPKIGEKKSLVELLLTNAKEILSLHKNKKHIKIQDEIYKFFELNSLPMNIEIFDNSHLSGEANVGAMVCFENDSFKKENYRHYHLLAHDEYSQMREMLMHRVERFNKLAVPDLWVIDGGKTLLDLALQITNSCGVNIDIIAISKEKVDAKTKRAKSAARDILHTKNHSYKLSEHDQKLQFFQLLRDEAHRFAITFHRKTKLKQDKQSSNLKQKGLSDAKIKKLLLYFGTFEAIYKADFKQICQLIGQKEALKLKQ